MSKRKRKEWHVFKQKFCPLDMAGHNAMELHSHKREIMIEIRRLYEKDYYIRNRSYVYEYHYQDKMCIPYYIGLISSLGRFQC